MSLDFKYLLVISMDYFVAVRGPKLMEEVGMQVEIFFSMETIRDPTFSCLVVPITHRYSKIFIFVPARQVRGVRPKSVIQPLVCITLDGIWPHDYPRES